MVHPDPLAACEALVLTCAELSGQPSKEAARAVATAATHMLRAVDAMPPPDDLHRRQALRAHAVNLGASADSLLQALRRGDEQRVQAICAQEIQPMVSGLVQRIQFEVNVAGRPERHRQSAEEAIARLAALHGTEDAERYEFEISIILCAFNKFEYTRRAVDALLRHTKFNHLAAELILVNNGSTDGTAAFFRTVTTARVIDLKVNTGPLGGFVAGIAAARGRYVVAVANDVIVTPRWLDQIHRCLKSDSRIGLVVPTCNSIANRQTIPTDYGNDLTEMERFADRHNRHDPQLWEDRARLMTFLAAIPTRLLRNGLDHDPCYSMGEFIDDDMCTMLRRAGYRMVLARDTFVHHFGSITLRDLRNENSLEKMRARYRSKWGIDAWEAIGQLDEMPQAVAIAPPGPGGSILYVDPLFGETALTIANRLRQSERALSRSDALVVDDRFLDDAKGVFDNARTCGTDGDLWAGFSGPYDWVIFARELSEIILGDPRPMLLGALQLVSPGGHLAFRIRNGRSARIIEALLAGDGSEGTGWMTAFFPSRLLTAALRETGCRVEVVGLRNTANDLLQPIIEHLAKLRPDDPTCAAELSFTDWLFVVERPSDR